MTSAEYNLGEYTFPRGWFMVAAGADIDNTPQAIRFFGQDLVIYRGASGRVLVMDAYCPHMGAHLAKNSTSYIVRDGEQTEGDSIRCPYHGWRFNAEGVCDNVPYSPTPPPQAARLKSWPVVERANCVFVWHDPENGPPDYAVPELPEWEDSNWIRWHVDLLGDIDCHPVEVIDNMADKAHFGPIHGSGETEYFENTFADHIVLQHFGAPHKTLSAEILSTETWYTGPGILMSRMEGAVPSIVQICHTPVDDGVIRVWHCVLVKSGGMDDAVEAVETARQYQALQRAALMQDYEIWANKRPCIQAMAVPGDGPFRRLRTWYQQFYNPRAKVAQYQARVNGHIPTRGTQRVPWPERQEQKA